MCPNYFVGWQQKGSGKRMENLKEKINLLVSSFEKILYDEDDIFLKNMQTNNLAGDNPERYRYWEWTQGVGLFGLWKIYEETGEEEIIETEMRPIWKSAGTGHSGL